MFQSKETETWQRYCKLQNTSGHIAALEFPETIYLSKDAVSKPSDTSSSAMKMTGHCCTEPSYCFGLEVSRCCLCRVSETEDICCLWPGISIPMRSQRCSATEGSGRWFTRSCWFVGWLQLQASPRLRSSAPPSTCCFLLRLQATPSIPSETSAQYYQVRHTFPGY